MGLKGTRTYVGFGFGAIQAGLFLYEAFRSGAFGRLTVAEVIPEVVEAVRRAKGRFTVNVAQPDHIEHSRVGPVAIENPAQEPDRDRLIDAIADAEEIGTALPSVAHYESTGEGSVHRILAAGLRKKVAEGTPRAVVYAAENHNRAAEILEEKVMATVPQPERESVLSRVQFLNTVIGKMSGVVPDPDDIRSGGLVTATPGGDRAFLVEKFNRILISRIQFDDTGEELPFRRGITVFEEKSDLLPFEEAKLFGHNATHALAAYLGAMCGVVRIADLAEAPGVMPFLRAAFLDESGRALVQRYAGSDPLFTPEGYSQYADDLLNRMINPYLGDTVERVGRDPKRKLAWGDRLAGTMRMALAQGVTPRRYAVGAAAALATLNTRVLEEQHLAENILKEIWRDAFSEEEAQTVLGLVNDGLHILKMWRDTEFDDLEQLFNDTVGQF